MKYLVILLYRASNLLEVSNLLSLLQLRRYRKRKMSDVEMDDLVAAKICVICDGEKKWIKLVLFGKKIVGKYTHYKLLLTRQNNQT